jgi:ribulose-phosphate 3-epimerase
MAYLAPSILSADLLKLEEQIKLVEGCGADFIHIDVMDGHFVPNLTFGPVIVKTVAEVTSLPLDVHLMMTDPDPFINQFAEAGANIITVHQETCKHLDRSLSLIKDAGCKAGVALNPSTPVHTLDVILKGIDLVLIMTVNPGFGGQKFILYSLEKIRNLRKLLEIRNSDCFVEVDGGINPSTGKQVLQAGADILVAGAAIFAQKDIAGACRALKTITNSSKKEV